MRPLAPNIPQGGRNEFLAPLLAKNVKWRSHAEYKTLLPN
jgi:hypothetical protein